MNLLRSYNKAYSKLTAVERRELDAREKHLAESFYGMGKKGARELLAKIIASSIRGEIEFP